MSFALLMLSEAINSVALEHPEGHDCVVCRAARGDREATENIVAFLASSE